MTGTMSGEISSTNRSAAVLSNPGKMSTTRSEIPASVPRNLWGVPRKNRNQVRMIYRLSHSLIITEETPSAQECDELLHHKNDEKRERNIPVDLREAPRTATIGNGNETVDRGGDDRARQKEKSNPENRLHLTLLKLPVLYHTNFEKSRMLRPPNPA